jgi:hypothetical protein
LFAVFLVLILGVAALALDGGLMMSERRHAQSVSDSAALAAAYSLYTNAATNKGLDVGGKASGAALAIASGNGYSNDGVTSTVTVNIPPLSGRFVGKAGYAEVLVQKSQPRLFSALWGAGTLSVTARSVARGITPPSNPAILLLDPSMKGSLNSTGNGGISVTGGSIAVDSNNGQAGIISGGGNVTAPNLNFTGGYSSSGGGVYLGTAQTGVAPTSDPLATLPAPDPTTMTVQSTSNYKITTSGNYTLQPGVYQGGIAITANAPGTVTLAPGIYYMQGGGFSDNGSIDVTGTGVMIYNAPAQNNDEVQLAGTGNVTLTAPTSGPYKGIAIFQDRTATATVDVTGNGSLSLTGTIYAAGAEVDVTGNGGITVTGAQIIANNMNVAGNGLVSVVYNPNAAPGRDTRLVE